MLLILRELKGYMVHIATPVTLLVSYSIVMQAEYPTFLMVFCMENTYSMIWGALSRMCLLSVSMPMDAEVEVLARCVHFPPLYSLTVILSYRILLTFCPASVLSFCRVHLAA